MKNNSRLISYCGFLMSEKRLENTMNNLNSNNKEDITFDFNFPMQVNSIECLIVLNGQTNFRQLQMLCKASSNIVLADGGANRFFRYNLQEFHHKIRAIVGDLDSIEQKVKQFFCKAGVEVVEIEDQDYNDFEKSTVWAMKNGWKKLAAVGAFGNRMDHTLSSLSLAVKLYQLHPHLELYLISSDSLMFLLRPQKHYKVKTGKWVCSAGCGLIPFGKVQYINTTGLKWNLGQKSPFSSLEWGRFISSSNEFTSEEITVYSSAEIFFTFTVQNQQK